MVFTYNFAPIANYYYQSQQSSTSGAYNITNGTAFQNTYGGFSNMVTNQSFVLQSDLNGNNWTFFNNSFVIIS
jgi:hypothetical protein